jgi:23S rRNA pseudouridine2457 synthase
MECCRVFFDAQGRPTLADHVRIPEVYAAGRLDLDSGGLMLLTSDGALAHHITDPQHKLPKLYLAQVERIPDEEALEQLRWGVLLNGKRTRPADVQLLSEAPNLPDRPVPIRFRKSVPTTWLQITLREGLNRQVRRMTAAEARFPSPDPIVWHLFLLLHIPASCLLPT